MNDSLDKPDGTKDGVSVLAVVFMAVCALAGLVVCIIGAVKDSVATIGEGIMLLVIPLMIVQPNSCGLVMKGLWKMTRQLCSRSW